jgi:adenine-specific DNA-methyltransferase
MYSNVTVFCSNGICRNNLGNWETRRVQVRPRSRGAQFYAAKDRAMAQEATVGLMVWDGKSIGTLLNVFRLISLQKSVVVYVAPERGFQELRRTAEWHDFVEKFDHGLRNQIERRTSLEAEALSPAVQHSLFG